MAYEKTNWIDHVLDGEGKVVQQGTPVNAENLNKMEDGIENSVSKDGGDTINGGVKFKSRSGVAGGAVLSEADGASVSAFDDASNENGDRQVLKVNTTNMSDDNTAVQLKRTKNGETKTFDVLHTGNKSLVKPEDIGAAPASHGNHVSYSEDNPLMDGTANKGNGTSVARGDHRHPTDTSRAPVSHSSGDTTYGVGNNTVYGHLKLSDDVNNTSGINGGVASTPAATKLAYDLASSAKTTADEAQKTVSGKADASHGNHVPATETADSSRFLRNDNTWQKVTPANIGAVPTSRTVNGKALSGNITLSASDVGADASGSASAVQANLNAHTGNKNNPHGVTVSQIGAAPSSHTHDDRYYTEAEVNNLLNGKAPAYTYGTGDLSAGSSPLATGVLYFVYE